MTESFQFNDDLEEFSTADVGSNTKGLLKWELPQNPFTQWDMEFLFVCFNHTCPFLVRGWGFMYRQGNMGMSYRFAYNPDRDQCMSVPVRNLHALKEGIVE